MAAKGKNKRRQNRNLMNDVDTRSLRVIFGVIFLVLTLFSFAALASYIFTWRHDVSLLTNEAASAIGTDVSNIAGVLGFKWAHLLFAKLFGLGAFAVPIFLGAITIAFFRIKSVNLLKVLILSFTGSVILSVLCAFIFGMVSKTALFGNGAGGSYGHFINDFLHQNIGSIGTGGVLFVAVLLWAMLCSKRVAIWFDDLIFNMSHRKVEEQPIDDEPEPMESKYDDSFKFDTDGDDAIIPEQEYAEDEIPDSDILKEPSSPDPIEDDINVGFEVEIEASEKEEDFLAQMSEDEQQRLFDPRLDLPKYQAPSLSLLDDYSDRWYEVSREELEKNKNKIVKALANYNIKVVGITAQMGPTVTLYKIKLDDGMKVAQVRSREEDIALALGKLGVRIVVLADAIGIEVPNEKMSVVPLKALLSSEQFKSAKMELPMALGITVTNEPFFLDLAKLPHLLVAGATGTGKSVGLNVIINSLIFSKHPTEMKLVVVDPKEVEFSLYANLDKHFLAKLPDEEDAIITDTKKVIKTMNSLCQEMDDRYSLMKLANVRHISDYNKAFLARKLNPMKGHKFMPYIVVIIDEFADLIMTAGREIEQPLGRLAQKARAIGIHLIFATQRPTTTVITGNMKSNFNTRISFKVNSSVDSKTILDATGANRLIGRGDMLVLQNDLVRVQCALIDTDEIKRVVKFISDQRGLAEPYPLPYVEESTNEESGSEVDMTKRDSYFEEAAKLIVQYQIGSTSLLQRKFNVGYARAGRLMDQLEAAGVVGPQNGSKARDVLINDFDTLDRLFDSLNHATIM